VAIVARGLDDRAMAEQTLLSVRGEARRTIAPDCAVLHGGLQATGESKADALGKLRASQQVLIGALTELGGVALTVDTRRSALTWSISSVGTYEERDFNQMTGREVPTGRVIANATTVITVRDLDLVDRVGDAIASIERLSVHGVGWIVDADNEQWRGVRADAIAAALAKGRDYADALGGTVTGVEHVADAGLLSAGDLHHARAASLGHAEHASATFGGEFDGAGGPSLDPVPQEIHAVVEVRLAAAVSSLR
jgi:uncharacterized protein YggE